MENKKQSSIDWLIEQLEEKGRAWENVSIRRLNISIDVSDYLKLKHQAKAMHKEEILIAYSKALPITDGVFNAIDKAHDYYNETFGGEQC